MSVTIISSVDPDVIGRQLTSPAGADTLLKVLQRNSDEVREILMGDEETADG